MEAPAVRTVFILVALVAGLAAGALNAVHARKEFAVKENKDCMWCHMSLTADAPLNSRGREYLKNGYRFPIRKVPPRKKNELSRASLLLRRSYLLGRKLFFLDKVGRKRISCASCHGDPAPAHPLDEAWKDYPTYHPGLDRVATLEDAINYCITERMAGKPLKPGSPSAVALQLYIKERSRKSAWMKKWLKELENLRKSRSPQRKGGERPGGALRTISP